VNPKIRHVLQRWLAPIAFAAVVGTHYSGSPWIGVLSGMIGGLLFATCATLFLVPTMFSLVHGRDRLTAEPAPGHAPAPQA